MYQWRVLLNTVVSLRIPWKVSNFLPSRVTRVVLEGFWLNHELGYPGTWGGGGRMGGDDITYRSHPGHRLCRGNTMLYSSPN